jgi:hypothetical protein
MEELEGGTMWNCGIVIRKDLKIASEQSSTTIAGNGPLLGDALGQMALPSLMDGSKERLQGTRNSSDRFNLPARRLKHGAFINNSCPRSHKNQNDKQTNTVVNKNNIETGNRQELTRSHQMLR